jgi:hypothetical protein
VVVDVNRTVEMLDDLDMTGYYSPSVQQYIYLSTHSYASVGRGVVMDWGTERGPLLRIAAPHEYGYPGDELVQ